MRLVKLTTLDGTEYEVVLDDKGIELGTKMDGKQVDVIGVFAQRKGPTGRDMFVVSGFREHVSKVEIRKPDE